MMRALLLLSALSMGCDETRPLLVEVDEMGEVDEVDGAAAVELREDACVSIQECCGVESSHCELRLEERSRLQAYDVQLAVDHGLEITRDETCSLLPFEANVAAACREGSLCEAPCKAWVGTVPAGGECRRTYETDDCAQGLLCFADGTESDHVEVGTCADPCQRVGETCNEQDAEWPTGGVYLREGSRWCGPAAFCAQPDPSMDGVCEPVRLEGDPCSMNDECAPRLYCDVGGPASICVPLVREGEPCSGNVCADGLLCHETTGLCTREWNAPGPDAPVGCKWVFD